MDNPSEESGMNFSKENETSMVAALRTKATNAMAVALAAALLMIVLGACSKSAKSNEDGTLSGTVSTNGSTSMERVVGGLAEAFMSENPDVTITYDATGSGTGIECASNGTCDIGLASRDLSDSETGLTAIPVALDGIAVIVSPGAGVDNLRLDDVRAIFTGEVTNWSEIGGADLPISCIGRESGSGTRDGFESVTGTDDACVLDQELTSTGAVITAVSSSSNAIGYVSLSAVETNESVQVVTIDGIACTEQTVIDGSYPIQRPFVLVIREDAELSEAARAFVDFATSDSAADLIRDAGAIPVV
jgi:phosphate transport system substrate-binding protein